MSGSNNDKTNSADDESNSNDDKTKSTDDESNLDDSLKPLSSSIDLSVLATLSPIYSVLATLSLASSILATLSPAPSILATLSPAPSVLATLSPAPSVLATLSPASSVFANLSDDLSISSFPSMDSHKLLATSIDYSQTVAPPSKQIKIIKHIFDSATDSRKVISQDAQIKDLIDSHKERKLVLVLGAGVSKNYGLPDWNTLLQKLLIKILGSKQKPSQELRFDAETNVLKTLFPQSPIILARNIQLLFDVSEEGSFENLVRESMYEQIKDTKVDCTFEELQKLCTPCETGLNVDSIITLNFDDILEKYLTSKVCEPIYEVGIKPKSGKLPVYHVHGFLPRKESKEKLDKSNKIIF